jgi:hypothetical protein
MISNLFPRSYETVNFILSIILTISDDQENIFLLILIKKHLYIVSIFAIKFNFISHRFRAQIPRTYWTMSSFCLSKCYLFSGSSLAYF